jgi:prephenate dehydratase
MNVTGPVAFQGDPGAYSDEALTVVLGEVGRLPCRTLRDVFALVTEGTAAAAIVPAENSFAGSVYETYDLLLASPLHIIGEVSHRVDHCLLAPSGTSLSTLARVLSHPQALAQCEVFLRAHGLQPVPEYDTAGAARRVAAERPPQTGAIAGRRAARLYGLTILAEAIQTAPLNLTRFLLLAREPAAPSGQAKTSLVFGTANVPGALYRALGAFARRGLNLTKLESRPAQERPAAGEAAPWEYIFYVDVEAHAAEPIMAEALDDLRGVTSFLRVLGSYPRAPR